MTYLIFSREPQEGELPLLGKLGPQIIRYHLTHPEPQPGGKVPEPMIRVEFRVSVGDSLAYGSFILSIPEAKISGLLEYEFDSDNEMFVHKKTGLKIRTLQMDISSPLVLQVSPVEGKNYLNVTELGFDGTPRFKSWGNYAKRSDRVKTGADFAALLAKAKAAQRGTDEPTEPEPEPEPAEPAPAPVAKRRRVAI
jgi:hypothetical protein